MQESLEKGFEHEVREHISPHRLEETPPFPKELVNALFEQLPKSAAEFRAGFAAKKGTKKPWGVFEQNTQRFFQEYPLPAQEEKDKQRQAMPTGRQALLAKAILEAPRLLLELEFKLAALKEQKIKARNFQERKPIEDREKKIKEESADWQHCVAAFILIHRGKPGIDIEKHMREFWQRLTALEESLMSSGLRDRREKQGETKNMTEAAREGIARAVTVIDVLHAAGFKSFLPTALYDREYGHDFYATPQAEPLGEQQRPLYAFQIKPLKADSKGPLYIEQANADSATIAYERPEIDNAARGLRDLRAKHASIGARALGAVYIEVPVGPAWPGISPATGLVDESFRRFAERDIDKRLEIK